MAETLPIIYSPRSLADAVIIKNFILSKFTQREVDNFYKMLASFEKVVTTFPHLYPKISSSRNVRRAVLSKQLSVFYNVSNSEISIAAILDNRMDIAKWPK